MKTKLINTNLKIKTYFTSQRFKNSIKELLKTLLAILIAYLIAIIVILIAVPNKGESLKAFIIGPFSNSYELGEVLVATAPLILTGIGACLIVRSGRFNMFTEGGFYIGALIAAIFTIYVKLPGFIAVLLALAISGIATGAIGYVPAKLKEKLNVNEFVSSIMLNFILLAIGLTLITYNFNDPDYGLISTLKIPAGVSLPKLGTTSNADIGIFIAIGISIVVFVALFFTKRGFEIRMTGDNPSFARNVGIKTSFNTILAQVVGTGLAGVGGAIHMFSKVNGRFDMTSLTEHGFDGFMIAIIAKNNPILVPLAALFLAYMRHGGQLLNEVSTMPHELIKVVQGLIIILVAARAFGQMGYFKKITNYFRQRKEVTE